MNSTSTPIVFMGIPGRLCARLAKASALCLLAGFLLQSATAQPPSFSSLANPSAQPKPLALEEAFPFFVSTSSPGQYRISWNLAPGHYLYRHAFGFALQQSENGELLETDVTLPDGLKKTDQFFGDIEAYYDQVVAELSLPTVPGPQARLVIEYQGCADWGFCYPPQRVSYPSPPESHKIDPKTGEMTVIF